MGFGEAFGSGILESVLAFVLFMVIVFGGFGAISRWLKKKNDQGGAWKWLKIPLQCLSVLFLIIVFSLVAIVINSLTGFHIP